MASIQTNPFKVLNVALWSTVFMVSMAAISVSSYQFQVGGERGWAIPPHNLTVTYNDWAAHHRFRIGDTLYFRYQNDSVLVVDSRGYQNCITSKPISKFEDGETVFEFDRSGFFYFISGQQGHCEAGQKMIIRVMHPSETDPPSESAPGGDKPWSGSGSGGNGSDTESPRHKSDATLSVTTTYFTSVLGGVIMILYLFT